MAISTGDGPAPTKLVTLADIKEAHARIAPHVHRTPLLTSATLDQMATAAVQRHLAPSVPSSSSSSSKHVNIRVRLAFKSEHLQRVGAFKMRGATNAVQTHLERLRSEAAAAGEAFDPSQLWVVTHSSGNHAGALACAAKSIGARCAVVMPRSAPAVKKAAVAGYGARIVECEPTQAAREDAANKLMAELEGMGSASSEDGASLAAKKTVVRFVHPYDEELVIAGQGTLALEMLQQADALQGGARRCSEAPPAEDARQGSGTWSRRSASAGTASSSSPPPPLDLVVAPVGGGGMLSGVATAIKGKDDRIVVYAAEPKGECRMASSGRWTQQACAKRAETDIHPSAAAASYAAAADDAARSFRSGELQPAIVPPKTICDGLLTALSPRTLKHVQAYVKDIFTADEAHIVQAMQLVWERMKQTIEPSAAVGLAVVLNSAEFAHAVYRHAEQKGLPGVAPTTNGSRGGGIPDEPVEVRIGIVWTGGNVELATIASAVAAHGLKAG